MTLAEEIKQVMIKHGVILDAQVINSVHKNRKVIKAKEIKNEFYKTDKKVF